ncbi:hypothetical protein SNE40_011715 [Patella caerulea]|uniref:Myeloid-derived growth factor n=2 Tax=Patella caerulea TaxID=87958 RepID=A0AAN8JP61_PATCE
MYLFSDVKCIIFMIICLIQWIVCYEMSEDKIQVSEFDVIPGGSLLSHEKEWNGFVCKFSYTCQGGTKEQWLMGLSLNKDQTKFQCSVERPGGGGSYLFFQSFKLEISGADVKEGEAAGSSNAPLKPSEYVVDLKENMIADVPGKFASHLERVTLYSEKGRSEL